MGSIGGQGRSSAYLAARQWNPSFSQLSIDREVAKLHAIPENERFTPTVKFLEHYINTWSSMGASTDALYPTMCKITSTLRPDFALGTSDHDRIVGIVAKRLAEHTCSYVITNPVYGLHRGIPDILRFHLSPQGVTYRYYEVKSFDLPHCHAKAEHQFNNFIGYMHEELSIPFARLGCIKVFPVERGNFQDFNFRHEF